MPQQNALGALQFVVADVIGERAERFEHLPRDGFRPDVFLAHPRMLVGKGVEGGIDELPVRLRVFELLQFLHPLVVFDPFHLHLGHLLVLHLVELFAQDDVRVFEDGFHERQQDERVIRRLRIHQRNRLEQIQRQRLVHREILLQLDVHAKLALLPRRSSRRERLASLFRDSLGRFRRSASSRRLLRGLMNSTIFRSSSERNNCQRAFDVRLLLPRRFVTARNELLHRAAAVALFGSAHSATSRA